MVVQIALHPSISTVTISSASRGWVDLLSAAASGPRMDGPELVARTRTMAGWRMTDTPIPAAMSRDSGSIEAHVTTLSREAIFGCSRTAIDVARGSGQYPVRSLGAGART